MEEKLKKHSLMNKEEGDLEILGKEFTSQMASQGNRIAFITLIKVNLQLSLLVICRRRWMLNGYSNSSLLRGRLLIPLFLIRDHTSTMTNMVSFVSYL